MSHQHAVHTQLAFLIGAIGILLGLSVSTVWAVPICSISGMTPVKGYIVQDLSLATGDFNGDGRPDIATGAGILAGGVSIMLNDGAGAFNAPVFYATGAVQYDVVTGDFNADGKLDVVTANYFDNTISLLLGIGDGRFNPAMTVPTGGLRPSFLASGDFNRDGMLDLAVANAPIEGQGNISILTGNGSGGFAITTPITPHTQFMRAADFNGDGYPDVIGVKNQLALFLNNGVGGFSSQLNVNTAIPVTNFVINDLNHDNIPDIAAVSGSNTFSIILGNGNGTFSAPTVYQISVLDVGSFVTSGDVNGDGNVDVVLSNGAIAGRVFVMMGNGVGSFTLTGNYPIVWADPGRIVSADFNGDGRSDIAAGHETGLSVLLSTCLTATPRYDFDGDGKSDIGVYRPSSGTWYSLRSSNDSFQAQGWGIATDRIVAGDYDGDSKTDLAVYRPPSGTWFILRSTNNTFVAQAFGISTDVPVPADYDADGKTDLAVYRAGTWYILRSSDNQLITQSFGTASDKPMPADYDGDGKADIAVYRPTEGTWYIQQSMNDSFRAQAFGTNTDVPVSGDFDGDGKADVAVYRPLSGMWYALRSGNSSLLAERWGVDTDIPVAADYDGDGKTDLAVFRPSNGTWYINRSSDGALTAQSFGLSTDVPIPFGYVTP